MYEHNGGLAKKHAPGLGVYRPPGGKQVSPHDTAGLGLPAWTSLVSRQSPHICFSLETHPCCNWVVELPHFREFLHFRRSLLLHCSNSAAALRKYGAAAWTLCEGVKMGLPYLSWVSLMWTLNYGLGNNIFLLQSCGPWDNKDLRMLLFILSCKVRRKKHQGVSRNNAIRGRVSCLQKINTVIEIRDII